jgi:glutaredoxin 3
VRDFLTQHGIPFVERNIRKDPTARTELLERTGGMIVPVVFVNGQTIVGWDEARLLELLESGTP